MSAKARKRKRASQSKTKGLGEDSARESLVRAAKKLFARKGLSGTSIRDIAQLAGLNSSLISYYFGGKEELYRACVRSIAEGRLRSARDLLRPAENEVEFQLRLKMFVENMFGLFMEDRDAGLIILREYDRARSPAENEFREGFLKVYELLIDYFRHAQGQGIVEKDKDPIVLASLLLGCFSNEMRFDHLKERMFKRSIKDPQERERVEAHIVSLFVARRN